MSYEDELTELINKAWEDGDVDKALASAAELDEVRKLHEFMGMDCE